MIKLPTTELNKLIDTVLTKRQWTQNRLSQELNLKPNAITRWRSGTGIHKGHYQELLELAKDEIITVPTGAKNMIPFSITIPKESLNFAMDKNGNINISGLLEAKLDNKEE